MQASLTTCLTRGLAALVLSAACAAAFAQPAAAPQATGAALQFQKVIDRVVTQGYRDVREVERKSDRLFEVKARNAQGRWVELYVDARSGEILREEILREDIDR